MMSEKKFVRKYYWVHQYEEEGDFLSDMRSQGWKFVALHRGFPTKYEFDKCEPEDYIYQLDYVKGDEDTEAYHQLFKDATWEEVYFWDGVYNAKWYYFCKKVNDGKKEKLYTDSQSKLDLANKFIMTYGVFFMIIMFLCINSMNASIRLLQNPTGLLWLNIPLIILMAFVLFWMGYCEVGMLFLKKKLKSEIENNL